jgi:hypothetical protein
MRQPLACSRRKGPDARPPQPPGGGATVDRTQARPRIGADSLTIRKSDKKHYNQFIISHYNYIISINIYSYFHIAPKNTYIQFYITPYIFLKTHNLPNTSIASLAAGAVFTGRP